MPYIRYKKIEVHFGHFNLDLGFFLYTEIELYKSTCISGRQGSV